MAQKKLQNILLVVGLCVIASLASVFITYQIVDQPLSADPDVPTFTQKDLNAQGMMSNLWMEQSGEYNALCYQAFNTAKLMYELDLTGNPSTEPRAVIVDIDETILNNIPQQAAYIGTDNTYPYGWSEWINAAQAEPLPGAVDFLNYVVANGGEVFYITNRGPEDQEGTLKNLDRFGFPLVDTDHLMLAEGTSDKEARRQAVAQTHRIVLLMGDNLNDFADDFYHKNATDRKTAVDLNKNLFGVKYIPLPNPVYGDWESAIYNYQSGLTPAEKAELRDSNLIRYQY